MLIATKEGKDILIDDEDYESLKNSSGTSTKMESLLQILK